MKTDFLKVDISSDTNLFSKPKSVDIYNDYCHTVIPSSVWGVSGCSIRVFPKIMVPPNHPF